MVCSQIDNTLVRIIVKQFLDEQMQIANRSAGSTCLRQLGRRTIRMENAHLRLGLLEYVRITEKASTRIRLRVDRYIGEDRQAHLLSVFGNDSDVGAITAAVHEKAAFSLTFPDGTTKDVTLGEHASCYKGAVTLLGRKHPVRHLLSVSQGLHTNGSAGRTVLLRYPARGGVGHAGELPGAACRSNMGSPHSWNSRRKEEDRGD